MYKKTPIFLKTFSAGNSIKLATFPLIRRHVDITSFYRKVKKGIKGNYRLVSILLKFSKKMKNTKFFDMSMYVSDWFQYPAITSGNVREMENVYQ